jgi:MFS family permease
MSELETTPPLAAPAPANKGLGSRYWRLWSATVVSNAGDGIDAAALPLLAATLTRDPRLVAGMGVAFTLPWLLFALPAGAIVDRLDRRKVMYRVNIVRAALVAVIALSVAADTASIWLLYVVAFLLGTCETLFDNAAQSIMPSIVRPNQLELANGRQYAGEVVANTFVGPPLGGFLFAAAASAPFWIDSGSFLLAALLVASLAGSFRPAGARAAGERRSLRADIAEGVRWLRHHRLLRTLALVLGALNFASWLGMSTFVLFAQEILGLDDAGFGLLLAGMAVGSVLGGIFGARIARALGPGRALIVSIMAFCLPWAAVGLMSSAVAVALLMWISSVFTVVWNIITVSLRQQIIPDHLLGRVNSVYRFLGWGSMPLGALAGGWLADVFGLRAPWLIGGAVVAVTLVLALPRISTKAIEEARAEAGVDLT